MSSDRYDIDPPDMPEQPEDDPTYLLAEMARRAQAAEFRMQCIEAAANVHAGAITRGGRVDPDSVIRTARAFYQYVADSP